MRATSLGSLVAAAVALFAGTNAQTGQLMDLATLLSEQKNLTTFYGLIQVCPSGRPCVQAWRQFDGDA